MIDTQSLRKKILQLAIEGKLVPQDKSEGTGAELLKTLQSASLTAPLVRGAKKALPPVTPEEEPFVIPDNWCWCRLGEIVTLISGTSYNKNDVTNKGLRVLRGGNIQSNNVLLQDDDVYLPYNYVNKDRLLRKGDVIIVASTGSKEVIGKPGFVNQDMSSVTIGAFLRICRPLLKLQCYSKIIFLTTYYRQHIRNVVQGTNINNIKEAYISELPIPLPPLAEQKRIVAKVEEAFSLLDEIDRAQQAGIADGKALHSKLLQLAIEGKLVPQDKSEGTGADLLQKIRKENPPRRNRGQEKRHPSQSEGLSVGAVTAKVNSPSNGRGGPILERGPAGWVEEEPFVIPDNWCWCRLGEIIEIKSGDNITSSQMKTGNIPVFGGNGIAGYHNEYNVEKETIVIGRVGFYCGSVHVTPEFAWVTDNAFITSYSEKLLDRRYLVYVLKQLNLGKSYNATAQPVVSGKKIYPIPFPLPPLAEQKRIVAKLEELLPLCESLESR